MRKITNITDTHVIITEEGRSFPVSLDLLNFSPRLNDKVDIFYHPDGSIERVTLVPEVQTTSTSVIDETKQNQNLIYFLLLFFLTWIGSLIINYSSLKPNGWKSRTLAHFFLNLLTFGLYSIIVAILALNFDENRATNIGFFRD
ncbi:MAG: hypothetical protein QM205_03320 [Bacillota bacterium]|jgi:hypothetical protein|nr:hypothetical protein [Bacillota bacterium]